jgi:hypothetical protein
MTYHITIHESLPYEVHKEASSLRERERQRQQAGGVREAWVEEIFLLPT